MMTEEERIEEAGKYAQSYIEEYGEYLYNMRKENGMYREKE